MGLLKTGFSAIGKFFIVLSLAAAFIVGMVGVVYMSLRGEEVKIPEIVGKDFDESEKELAALGLKVKRIANRYSAEKPNTILEQRPRAGDSAKTGLMISVIVAQPNPEGTEAPAEIKKKSDEDSIEEIEELISDKPKNSKKSNTNSTKKKSSTTRDVIKEKDNQNSDTTGEGNSNGNSKTDSGGNTSGKDNKTGTGNSNNKQTTPANSNKSNPVKNQPGATKPPSGNPPARRTPTSN
jgi:hypothetical protein